MCDGILALLNVVADLSAPGYREYAEVLEAFAFTHLADPGEWYTTCQRDGSPLDDSKGGQWKAAYHTVQLCADAVRILEGSHR